MANVLVQESSLQGIASAIRTKNGTQNTYKPSQMAEAIENIPSGGITPTGTINITANGTHDVTNYASAEVNVPTGTTPTGTKQISITQNGTTTEDVSTFANAEITVNVPSTDNTAKLVNGTITKFSDDAITYVKDYAFLDCARLVSVNIPNVVNIRNSSFSGCTNLTDFKGHKISAIQSSGQYAFRNCSKLETIALPLLNDVCANTFNGCSKLKKADVLGQYIRASAFANCTVLNELVIRKTSVASLANINAFSGTPFASGGAGGTLYVPSSLISTYQSASNWATILGYANNNIVAIEGSAYETTYADGTPIS